VGGPIAQFVLFDLHVGGFSESDLVVLTNTLNQDLSDYARPDVELVVSPVKNAVAPATQSTCLQLPTPDTLTRLGDSRGHIKRGMSRILRARAYLDLLTFCRPSPPDYMRVILGTGRGALALFSLHMSQVSRCHPIAIRWQPTGCLACGHPPDTTYTTGSDVSIGHWT
jgi:hypothetical protein